MFYCGFNIAIIDNKTQTVIAENLQTDKKHKRALTIRQSYCYTMIGNPKIKFNYKKYYKSFIDNLCRKHDSDNQSLVAQDIVYLDNMRSLKVFENYEFQYNTQVIANGKNVNVILWTLDSIKCKGMVNCLKRIMCTIVFMLHDCYNLEI